MNKEYKVTIRVGGESVEGKGSTPLEAFFDTKWDKPNVLAEVTVSRGGKEWKQLFGPFKMKKILNNKLSQELFNKYSAVALL